MHNETITTLQRLRRSLHLVFRRGDTLSTVGQVFNFCFSKRLPLDNAGDVFPLKKLNFFRNSIRGDERSLA